jgi:hypothetical protein
MHRLFTEKTGTGVSQPAMIANEFGLFSIWQARVVHSF